MINEAMYCINFCIFLDPFCVRAGKHLESKAVTSFNPIDGNFSCVRCYEYSSDLSELRSFA